MERFDPGRIYRCMIDQDAGPLKGTKVLLAEDEAVLAIDYADQLMAAGADVIGPFARAADAVNSLNQSAIDVAVIDYALQDRNSARLQEELEARRIPFIIVTGYPRVLIKRRGDEQILYKPVGGDVLCRTILNARKPSADRV